MTMRALAVAAGALTVTGMLVGFALGVGLGGRMYAGADTPEFANLDPAQPGSQALIREIGTLSGRMSRLEALAGRLAKRIGGTPAAAVRTAVAPARITNQPAGGPLLAPLSDAGPSTGAALLRLDQGLAHVEARLDRMASLVARRDLDQMAFPSRTPVPGVAASSGFGRRLDPFTGQLAQHAGVDFTAPYGTQVLASAGGRVRRAGPYGAFGRTIEISHGDGLVTRYGHVSRILVKVGDLVLPGQPIATVGSTGRSTGPHLHFEILHDGRQVHPDLYLAGTGP
ncbi:MAG: M23 family metallopeptidase [Gammaproteobacteria bacterium]